MKTLVQSESVNQFFEQNYISLAKFCRSRYNGSGEDVLHEAYIIAAARYRDINFSLFTLLSKEAARKLRLANWKHDDRQTIITLPGRAAQRQELELACGPEIEAEERTPAELRAARRLLRAEEKGQPSFWTNKEDKK